MVKKTETPTEETPVVEKPAPKAKSGKSTARFFCYIGPTIIGLIKNGTIYRGTRKDALSAAAAAIEKQPLVEALIVSGADLPAARLSVKKPGNALYDIYNRIAGMK